MSSANTTDPESVVRRFNDCINNRDIDGLSDLMTEDHTFIDRDGKAVQSKRAMIDGWRQFFKQFPVYRNTFERIESRGDSVTVLGFAFWSEQQPHDAVIWKAIIEGGRIREWRIYVDTDANRREFGFL